MDKKMRKNIRISPWAYRAGLAASFFLVLTGLLWSGFLFMKGLEHVRQKGFATVSIAAGRVGSILIQLEHGVTVMSGSPWIYPALLSGTQDDIDKANSVLDRYNSGLEASVSYLMNKDGLTIASSNRGASDSFVGKNYRFRPYFKEAFSGRHFRDFALGVTSGMRGFYASHPVKDPQGNIVGVIAIKKDLDIVEKEMADQKYCFLVSPEGVIFLSTIPELVFKSLGPISPDKQTEMITKKQFGDGPFEAVMDKIPVSGDVVNFKGSLLVAGIKQLNDDGWKMVMLEPLREVWLMGALGILVTVFFIGFILTYLRYLRFSDEVFERLGRSEDKFEMLANSTNEGVVVHENGRILEANARFADMMGYSLDELIGKDFFDLLSPEDIAESRQKAGSGYDKPYEAQFYKRDGTKCLMEICGKSLVYKDRNVRVGSIRDISEYKQMQDVLQKVAQEWVTTFNSIPDLICIHDRSFRIVRANRAFADHFGMRLDEIIGKTVYQVVYKTDLAVRSCPFEKDKGRETGTSEFHDLKMGFSLEVTSATLYDEGGEVSGVVHVAKDVSERIKMEKALRESEQVYRSVIDNIAIGVALISPDMKILTLNRQMREWFPEAEVSKESLCQQVFKGASEESGSNMCPTHNTFKEAKICEAVVEVLRPGGRARTFRVISSPIKDDQGNVMAAIEIWRI